MSESALLDTHVLLWYDSAPQQLSEPVRQLLRARTNVVYVSAISALEIAIKYRLGKLPQAKALVMDFELLLRRYGFQELPLESSAAIATIKLKSEHADPFDRVLAAQAQSLGVPLVTKDPILASIPGLITVW